MVDGADSGVAGVVVYGGVAMAVAVAVAVSFERKVGVK
jgi:hypothetical protein